MYPPPLLGTMGARRCRGNCGRSVQFNVWKAGGRRCSQCGGPVVGALKGELHWRTEGEPQCEGEPWRSRTDAVSSCSQRSAFSSVQRSQRSAFSSLEPGYSPAPCWFCLGLEGSQCGMGVGGQDADPAPGYLPQRAFSPHSCLGLGKVSRRIGCACLGEPLCLQSGEVPASSVGELN